MADQLNVYTKFPVPETITHLLERRLPSSLPLLRRLQWASVQGDDSRHYRVVLVARCREKWRSEKDLRIDQLYHEGTDRDPQLKSLDVPFIMAFVEFGVRPDTQLWMYSTFEDVPEEECGAHGDVYRYQMRTLLHELRDLRQEYEGESAFGMSVLLGSAQTPRIMGLLKGYNRYKEELVGTFDKWLFRIDELPGGTGLPDGLAWSHANEEDCRTAISQASVPLPLETLLEAPNLVIRSHDDTPVCWGFLAPDGSLLYLHCKETYRRRGLAKALVAKLFREHVSEFGNDAWASADVHPENIASQAMCRSLGGRRCWRSSWVLFDLTMDVPR